MIRSAYLSSFIRFSICGVTKLETGLFTDSFETNVSQLTLEVTTGFTLIAFMVNLNSILSVFPLGDNVGKILMSIRFV